jgi:hypothetical protein
MSTEATSLSSRLSLGVRRRGWDVEWEGDVVDVYVSVRCRVVGGPYPAIAASVFDVMREGRLFDLGEAVDAVAGMMLDELNSGGRR